MVEGKRLDDIVREIEDVDYDIRVSEILKLSARIKRHGKLIKDDLGITNYYVCKNENRILNEIRLLGNADRDVLYNSLKNPLILMQGNDVYALKEYLDLYGVDYKIKKCKLTSENFKKLEERYKNGIIVNPKEDDALSDMYRISSNLKERAFYITLLEKNASFYLIDINTSKDEDRKIIDYLSSLNQSEISRFADIMGYFSVIDTKKDKLYNIISSKDSNSQEIMKLNEKTSESREFRNVYKILEKVRKTPENRDVIWGEENQGGYVSSGKAPSDMYL